MCKSESVRVIGDTPLLLVLYHDSVLCVPSTSLDAEWWLGPRRLLEHRTANHEPQGLVSGETQPWGVAGLTSPQGSAITHGGHGSHIKTFILTREYNHTTYQRTFRRRQKYPIYTCIY